LYTRKYATVNEKKRVFGMQLDVVLLWYGYLLYSKILNQHNLQVWSVKWKLIS